MSKRTTFCVQCTIVHSVRSVSTFVFFPLCTRLQLILSARTTQRSIEKGGRNKQLDCMDVYVYVCNLYNNIYRNPHV